MKYTDDECIELAKKNISIAKYEIVSDIFETEKEISDIKRKLGSHNGKLDIGYDSQIKEREEFISKLQAIMKGKKLLQSI